MNINSKPNSNKIQTYDYVYYKHQNFSQIRDCFLQFLNEEKVGKEESQQEEELDEKNILTLLNGSPQPKQLDECLLKLNALNIPKRKQGISSFQIIQAFSSLLESYLSNFLSQSELISWNQSLNSSLLQLLSQTFRIPPSFVGFIYLNDELNSKTIIGWSSMCKKFPSYESEGFTVLPKYPLIIGSPSLKNQIKQICLNLGLPFTHCTKFLPGGVANMSFLLDELLTKAKEQGNVPFLLMFEANLPFLEDLNELLQVAKKHACWFHLEGNALPFMAVDPIPEYLNCIFNCDSFTFNPIEWIDSRSNFSVNFIKDLSLVFSYSNYFPLKQSTKLSNLPLWIILQLLGTNYFSNNLSNNIQLSKQLLLKLKDIPNIEICNFRSPYIYFRFAPNALLTQEELASSLLNKLNEQMLLDLTQGVPESSIVLSSQTIDSVTYFSFNPFFSKYPFPSKALNKLLESVQIITSLIESTLKCRTLFGEMISKYKGLYNVKVENFIGLGAVRFVPHWLGTNEFGEMILKEIDNLNEQLAQELSKGDPLFWKLGKTIEGYSCVCLGVCTSAVTFESTKQYAAIIYQKCQELEKTSKIIEKLGELLREGIKIAQKEIEKEEEDQFWNQEGIIRQLPGVGYLMNWVSPIEKVPPKGRTFHLGSQSLSKTSIQPQPKE